MKRQILITMFFLGISLGLFNPLYAWDNILTHPALTCEALQAGNNAANLDDYLKTQLGLDGGIETELYWDFPADIKERIKGGKAESEKTTRTILEWLKVGSTIEDEDGRRWPIRPRHHFHDPYRNSGLDNKSDHPEWKKYLPAFGTWWKFDFTGESAPAWAIEGIAEQEPNDNNQSWRDARDHFYSALTEPTQTDREEYMAVTFLELGCILHMIEDMGVPAHARNDFIEAHFRGLYPGGIGNPLESWAEEQIEDNGGNIPSDWLNGWTPQAKVFSKLAHYWDINDHNGVYVGDTPLSNWGLSEQTNYQFLSKSTIFRENVIIDPNTEERTRYYFPHPDVNNVTDHTNTEVYLWGLVPVDYRYISGYNITHLARTKFIQKYAYMAGMPYPIETVAYHTTFDEAVYEDYAEVTIPRTIDYVTGLTNYFFRGRLNVEPNWTDPNIVELIITNDSNNSGIPQTLKGGSFELYWDDVNNTRIKIDPNNITFIPAWTPASTLPNDGGATKLIAQFAPPAEAVKKYIVVYKGNICENPADPDLDDPNAIAVAIIPCGYEIAAWAIDPINKGDKYGQVSNVPEGSDFVDVAAGKRHCLALKSDGSLVGWGYNTHGECDVPAGTDYTAIAAGVYHSIALKSDGSIVVWGYDNLGQITDKPSGNDFVAIAAGDYHSLALKSDGTIVGWGGYNDYGECDAPPPDPGTVFTAISAGKYHSLALQSDGVVKAWGSNGQGQTRIYDGAAGEVHVAIAACDYYSFLLRDDELLIAWGGGDWLEPGIPRYHYREPDGTDFISIAAGWDHILALTPDGEILSWYWPDGDYPFDYFPRDVPESIIFIDDIAAGYDFSLSLKAP